MTDKETSHGAREKSLRYRSVQIRIAACLCVALLVAVAVRLGALTPLEEQLRALFVAGGGSGVNSVARLTEIAILAALCIGPAILRIEQPLVMLACGLGFGFTYLLIVSIVLLTSDLILPMTAPLLGLLGSSAVLETMAWSDEVSRRRRLEELEAARQRFTDMLVHDLKKRMSSILIALSVLEKQTTSADPKCEELTATIRASAERMLLLTGNLLEIRRIEEGKMVLHREDASLRDILRACMRDHQVAANIAGVRLDLDESTDVRASVDGSVLSRVMSNLLWNALQHAPHGSTVHIRLGVQPDGAPTIRVTNRGEPIPPRVREWMFQPYVSGEPNDQDSRTVNTGLGLTFCKMAIEAHGGSIHVDSPVAGTGDGVAVLLTFCRQV